MTGSLITGSDILSRGLLEDARAENLKNSTYDLTIGDYFAMGPDAGNRRIEIERKGKYFIKPQEMIFVLSQESFKLPANITGIATLRTTFTKRGLLALNVGVIDPFFEGPISTALLNFSNRPVKIEVGDKFFRVIFIEHDDVSSTRPQLSESIDRRKYVRDLEEKSYADFPETYLSVPTNNPDYFYINFWRLVWFGLTKGWKGWFFLLFVGLVVWFVISETSFLSFYVDKLTWLRTLMP